MMRPDQRHPRSQPGLAGSRSGAGDTATALGYPGVPSAVPNCQGADLLDQPPSTPTLITFNAAGRLWFFDLTFDIQANSLYTSANSHVFARLILSPSGLVLATVGLGVSGPLQHDSGGKASVMPGLPFTNGESIILSVNSGAVIAQLGQHASCSVLYSYP